MSTQLLPNVSIDPRPESEARPAPPARAHGALAGPAARCALLALAVTVLMTALGVTIQEYYRARAHYHYDSASYRFQSIQIFDRYEQAGLGTTLLEVIQRQNSFDDLVRLLLYPLSLCQFHGHLWVQVPLMAIFFFLALLYVQRRTGSLLWGLAVVSMAFVFRPVYHPVQGITDYWKDNVAVWMLGSALLSWFLSERGSRRGWSFLSGVFWSMLALERPVAAVYGTLLFLPLLGAGVYRRFQHDELGVFLKRAVTFAAIPLATAGLMLAAQLPSIVRYYFVTGYDYASPGAIALWLLHHPFSDSLVLRLGVAAAFAVSLLAPWGRWRAQWADLAAALWLTAGFPALVIATHARYHMFAVVWLVLVIVSLALLSARHLTPRMTHMFALGLLALAGGASVMQARDCLPVVKHLAESNTEMRKLYEEIGEALHNRPPQARCGLFFDPCYALIWNQMYFDHGLKLNYRSFFMSRRESAYRDRFPGESGDEIADIMIGDMEREADSVVVTHEDPADFARRLPLEARAPTSLPMVVTRLIAEHLQTSERWQVVKRIESKRYGKLLVYRLLAPSSSADRRDRRLPQAARGDMAWDKSASAAPATRPRT